MNQMVVSLNEVIESQQGSFQEIAKEHNLVSFKKEAGFALQALQNNDFLCKIATQNPQSLKNAITNIAAIGISLNPAIKQAYLVPRDGKVCLDISYMGLAALATQNMSIKWVQAEVVREGETFHHMGIDKIPEHQMDCFNRTGKLKGVYCVAKLYDDSYLTTIMSIDEVYKIRDMSSQSWKSKKSGPWRDFEEEMVKKTVIKRATKLWPSPPPRLMKAIDVLNTESGEGIDFEAQKIQGEPPRPVDFKEKQAKITVINSMWVKATEGFTAEEKSHFMTDILQIKGAREFNMMNIEQLDSIIGRIEAFMMREEKPVVVEGAPKNAKDARFNINDE